MLKTNEKLPSRSRLEDIEADLLAYRNGWIAYDHQHVRDLQSERLQIIANEKKGDAHRSVREGRIMRKILAFIKGMIEFRSSWTTHYDDMAVLEAYDKGRDMAHAITMRYWDGA